MYLVLIAIVVVVLGTVLARYQYVARHVPEVQSTVTEPRWVRWTLTGIALVFMLLFLLLPLLAVFFEALRKGWDVYVSALTEPDAWSAIKLTLITALIAVPLNLVFGVQGQGLADIAGGPAFLGVPRRGGPHLCAAVWGQWLVWGMAGGP